MTHSDISPLEDWAVDPAWTHLNHGSYGARTKQTLRLQNELRAEFELNPTGWREMIYPERIAEAKAAVARSLGAPAGSLVFVPNVTAGITSALRAAASTLGPRDEILLLEHTYGSSRITAEQIAAEHGLGVRRVPFQKNPLTSTQLSESMLAAVDPRTRVVLLDHASSRTGVVYPLREIVAQLDPQISVIVDGAHGPGMLDMADIDWNRLVYVGAGYKWLCGSLGTAFMVSPPSWQERLAPTILSHGWETPDCVDRHHAAFDWPGGIDPAPWLSIAPAIEQLEQLAQGAGGPGARLDNLLHLRAGHFAHHWHAHWGTAPPLSEELQGAMRLLRLRGSLSQADVGELTSLLRSHHIEAKVTSLAGETMIRLSAHIYVTENDVDHLIWTMTRPEA